LEDWIGNTPLVALRRIPAGRTGAELRVKIEWMNPAGSVKDRPALWMIRDAEQRGLLDGTRVLLDSTSGNTGIAMAQIAAARGHRLTLCLPANAGLERKRILRLLGAELVLTDPLEGSDGAWAAAREMAAREPDRYVFLDQYRNPANWKAHYEGTALEIWEQTGGKISHFVSCLGTSGTFTGVSLRLRELNPAIERIIVQPDAAYHGIEGTKHYASTEVPPIFDPDLVTREVEVTTDEALEMSLRLAREEGLPAGISGGAAVAATLKVAEGLGEGLLVTVLPDHAMRSISAPIWEEGTR
jgi:S-sulfo-L-cysteine synthase (O-acetyl-L-serine-dependent)